MTGAGTEMAVVCRGMAKRFGGVPAVDGLHLAVRRGETVAVLGASGCGKTTLLRLIAGFETPDAGSIQVGGQTVAEPGFAIPPERRRVGMVFQNYALFPHLTAAENVGFGLRQATGRRERVREALALVGLDDLGDRYPHELSGGQQQRVALARALAPRPDVLLLDEPFSNLDAGQRLRVREEVREILAASGATALFVSHDQEEALFMGDQIAVMDAGRVAQVGTPEEVYGRPATRFVAEFFGPPGFLPGRAVAGGVETELGFYPQSVPLPLGTPLDLLARPDDLVLRPALGGNGRIARKIYRGMDYLYHIALPSGHVVQCLGPHTAPYQVGTPVIVTLEPGHDLRWFARNDTTYDDTGEVQ